MSYKLNIYIEVTEVRMVGLGSRGRRPVLLARLRDQEKNQTRNVYMLTLLVLEREGGCKLSLATQKLVKSACVLPIHACIIAKTTDSACENHGS